MHVLAHDSTLVKMCLGPPKYDTVSKRIEHFAILNYRCHGRKKVRQATTSLTESVDILDGQDNKPCHENNTIDCSSKCKSCTDM